MPSLRTVEISPQHVWTRFNIFHKYLPSVCADLHGVNVNPKIQFHMPLCIYFLSDAWWYYFILFFLRHKPDLKEDLNPLQHGPQFLNNLIQSHSHLSLEDSQVHLDRHERVCHHQEGIGKFHLEHSVHLVRCKQHRIRNHQSFTRRNLSAPQRISKPSFLAIQL